jgi:hypothetical protein
MDMPHFGSKLPIQENGQAQPTDVTRPAPQPTPAASGSAATDPGSASYVPSSELSELLSRLREFPEIRPEMVDAARARLAEGHYLSRSAAVQTAAAIWEA